MQEVSRDKKKRTRISNNKSKSGCLTCKGRRVKCDERQPSCLRCEKGNYRCEGFGIKSNVRLSERAVIPRIAANFQPILYQPQQTLFLSDREAQYFRLFCDQVVPQLTGHFESDLWSCLVLQTCDIDVSIRNAIIALAALISTSEVLYSTSSTDLVKSFDAHEHHQFAIRQYSKAIHAMRKAAVSGKQDLRTTLITSLVIVCFETFHGNHDSAAKQVVIGLDLIDSQALAKKEKKSSVPSIEEELTQIFERLDIQAMTFIDPRPGFRHKALTHIGQSRIDAMPKTLESMEEARNYLELIMRRCLHFMASLLPGTLPTGLLQVDIISCLPDEYVEGRDQHLDELRQWHFAFNPLLRNAQSPGGSKDFLRATSLELQYLSCFFILAIIPTTSQGTPDSRSFMPLFQQIVAGAEVILSHPSEAFSKSTYVFEIQVVCPLYAVAVCCPQRTLRRKAIRLLLDKPRRECLWDSSMVGKLAEWIVRIEEEAFEGEYAPEDVRTTCVDVLSFDMKTKEARVSCLAVDKESREWTKREAVVFW